MENLVRSVRVVALSVAFSVATTAIASDLGTLQAGKRIYEQGILSSGQPLVARLKVGVTLSGKDAACAKCHRVSGSGGFEGGNLIPPVTGPELFDVRPKRDAREAVASNIERDDFHFLTRPPYNRRSLGTALRTGVTPGGHMLTDLMPRYDLSKRDLAALAEYLRRLSRKPSPGYDGRTMDFATVLTPDASALDRQGLVDTLRTCFSERYPEDRPKGMRWRLNVWQLEGKPESWEAQLARFQHKRPVFAVVSGVGGAEWTPVHRFCESASLPCLFPTVDVPGAREPAHYSFYFSAGTLLEADVMGKWLGTTRPDRVVQIVAAGNGAARRGADDLAQQLSAMGSHIETLEIATTATADIGRVASGLGGQDALVLWLPNAQLSNLPEGATLAAGLRIIASGWLGDVAHLTLASPWRERMSFVYPFDPPARLAQRMEFNLRPWVAANGVAPAREMVLGNALTACLLLTEGISAQQGAMTREKLVEQIENYPSAMGNAPAPQVFHQFSLGPGQRFSSKGAFIVHFAGPTGNRLEPVGTWIIP